MAFEDLRTFLLHLEARGQLRRVRVEVDPVYEIAEIAQRVVREEGPALIFDRVKGSSIPLAINFLGSFKRIEMALGMHPEELGERLVAFAQSLNPPSVSAVLDNRDLFGRLKSYQPRYSGRGKCQEVIVDDPDLTTLPIIHCWPEDGGRFITFPLIATQHPVSQKSNLGIYRMQLFDKMTTGMHWQIQKGGGFHYHEAEKRGEALQTAVVLGADPALMLAAMFPLPEGFEEVAFAGILRERATRLVKATTNNIAVPANAEMILEGEVPPGERRLEGPFGDHFGHYCDAADFPVFRVRRITHRHKPIYPAAIVGKPPQEDRYMGDASQMIMGPLIRLIRPEVRNVWAYYEAGFHNLLVVSMESRYTREPIRTALGILGEGQLGLSKVVVLVDPSVDVRSFPHVLQSIRENFDPHENFLLIPRGPLDTLDFTSFEMHRGSRVVIDATGNRAQYSGGDRVGVPDRRRPGDDRGGVRRDPGEIAPHINGWRLWEDTLLAVRLDRTEKDIGRNTVAALVAAEEFAGIKIVAVVSPDVDLDDDVDLIWGIFTRFDPARDITFSHTKLTGIQPSYEGVMGIDATWKPGYPGAVETDSAILGKVDARWREYFDR